MAHKWLVNSVEQNVYFERKFRIFTQEFAKMQERLSQPFLSSSFKESGKFQCRLKSQELNGDHEGSEKCLIPRKSLLWTNFRRGH
jgi:hypothetical protein